MAGPPQGSASLPSWVLHPEDEEEGIEELYERGGVSGAAAGEEAAAAARATEPAATSTASLTPAAAPAPLPSHRISEAEFQSVSNVVRAATPPLRAPD